MALEERTDPVQIIAKVGNFEGRDRAVEVWMHFATEAGWQVALASAAPRAPCRGRVPPSRAADHREGPCRAGERTVGGERAQVQQQVALAPVVAGQHVDLPGDRDLSSDRQVHRPSPSATADGDPVGTGRCDGGREWRRRTIALKAKRQAEVPAPA
ncbi:hypothetical protein [Kitasatospora purpeofusca]|uniref:hypothetical protein n=1 Tax=Kitasatospora purpeofusca TaxID=67352 RepID=UPI00386C02F7|nr:hypothetical protein OIP63_39010 [Kitasatospora purpeofusca]